MRYRRQHCRLTFIVCCLLIAACTQETKRPGPKFTGRLLLLSGDQHSGADLLEISAAPNGSVNKYQVVTSGVLEAVASPDQTRVLYITKEGIMLRDFGNGAVKSLIAQPLNSCIAWAPDGKHFSFRQKQASGGPKLLVSDLDGKTKLIWEEKSDSDSQCPRWIAPDRLVFDRFVGAMTKPSGNEPVKPNTTTVVTVAEPLRFVDAPRKWSIEGVCPSGNAILTPADEPQPTFIASNIDRVDHVEKLNPTPGPTEGRFVGFAAKSCVPFFISQTISTATDLFSLNPTNWQRLRTASIKQTFSPSAKMLIKSSARLMIAGDVPDKLLLIDTESGDITPLYGPQEHLSSPLPVTWLED